MLVYVNWLVGFLVMFKFQFLKDTFSNFFLDWFDYYNYSTAELRCKQIMTSLSFHLFSSLSPLSHTLSLPLSPSLLGLLSWGYLQSSFVCEMALASFLFLQLRRNKVKHEITWSWKLNLMQFDKTVFNTILQKRIKKD